MIELSELSTLRELLTGSGPLGKAIADESARQMREIMRAHDRHLILGTPCGHKPCGLCDRPDTTGIASA